MMACDLSITGTSKSRGNGEPQLRMMLIRSCVLCSPRDPHQKENRVAGTYDGRLRCSCDSTDFAIPADDRQDCIPLDLVHDA
jgi:hypothetical protein